MENYFKHKFRGKSPAVIVGMVLFGIVAVTGLAILFGWIIMSLWNWLMPELFGLPFLTYWQAVGLFILAKILFGFGSGGGSSSSSGSKKKKKKKGDDWCKDDDEDWDGFSKWKHYDSFWKEVGEEAYKEYVQEVHKEVEKENETPPLPKEDDERS